MWASADQVRLRYLKKNQNKICASLYSEGDADLSQLGKHYILPSSYISGPRHMQQRFQDAMAIARHFRKEIEHELLPGQTSYDRPDLVAQVFQLKKAILEEITVQTNRIFRRTVTYVYTVEFQKRDLPHMHILIFLVDEDKLLTPEDIDSCISADQNLAITSWA
ncbi:hypothetical protein BDN71DRAFT_1483753 [Pleurotus eryngii]|uniref:Helitron helicase-like domain-containing protein n=1 Tax=Pleurotus eryngii TaxID=5323 RepID=A0A9P5ZRX8_PLEER|nr:hypothetical protein BDN71DRAFT_1483753 [Pleurotus eryngii]